jgi:CCR4-NOT transcription complex subunit 9
MSVAVSTGPPNSSLSSSSGREGIEDLYPLVLQLTSPEQRESALLELSKKREAYPDLAPVLWHSFGTIAALLQEIVSIYPMLSPPTLNPAASNRVCNALALLQCVASHSETKTLLMNGKILRLCACMPICSYDCVCDMRVSKYAYVFLPCEYVWSEARAHTSVVRVYVYSAHVPLYLYPFLNTVSKHRPFEYLRLTSLGVIGALVKVRSTKRAGGWPMYVYACRWTIEK